MTTTSVSLWAARAAARPTISAGRLAFALAVLCGVNTINFYDRTVLAAVNEQVKAELNLTDGQLGALGTAFILLYAVVGLPLGRWADVSRRTHILSAGVLLWSVLTAASGWAVGFWSLFVLRLGVGVGEASCAPAATSLLGDLFPAQRRARALALFMLGLPLGLGLSYVVSGSLGAAYGWRVAFFIAGLPGVVLSVLLLFVPEPPRGAAESHAVGAARRPGAPLLVVLRIPTLWWIVLSGALHNFNMYALGHFVVSYLVRYHELPQAQAGWVTGIQFGLCGMVGMVVSGWLSDRLGRRRASGRLALATGALALTVPLLALAFRQPAGAVTAFTAWMLPACALLYSYYAGVYPAIQDVVEPALRGTAMAVYFFAMYLLGAALGPFLMGRLSDYFAAAVRAADPALPDKQVVALGLHQALQIIPVLSVLLVLVLLAATWTIGADQRRLHEWQQQHGHG